MKGLKKILSNLNATQATLLSLLVVKAKESNYHVRNIQAMTAEFIKHNYMMDVPLSHIKRNLTLLRKKDIGVEEGQEVVQGTKRVYSTGFYFDIGIFAQYENRYAHVKEKSFKTKQEILKKFPKYVVMYMSPDINTRNKPDEKSSYMELRIEHDFNGKFIPEYYVVNGCWSLQVGISHSGKFVEHDYRLTSSGCHHLIDAEVREISEKEYKNHLKKGRINE